VRLVWTAALAAGLTALPTWGRAEVSLGAAIGAGAQGTATYGALELRLDAAWPGAGEDGGAPRLRLGLGARGVWDDAVFRRTEWARPADAIAIVRELEARHEVGDTTFALAAGRLAPARVGRLADGYRATLDDRWRTGVRAAVRAGAPETGTTLDVGAEVDDVLDPALVAAGVHWQMAAPWGMHAAIAADPAHATALEAGVHRRVEADHARAEAGVSVVAELGLGASVVAFGSAAAERYGARWTARADVRAGSGSTGALFGPLYRVERLTPELLERARGGELSGAGAGLAIGVAAPAGALELGMRARPGLGPLLVAGGAAPMGRWVQAGLWTAAARTGGAGAAELRVAWARRLYSAFQAARIYRLDAVDAMTGPEAVWSVTAWFGATSD
jgi:hypothetical protein